MPNALGRTLGVLMLPDVLGRDLRVVFCGTAASSRSALVECYYAGPGNKFWSILHETGLTPYQLNSSEFRLLLKFGIGLTDILKDQAGSDSDLRFSRDAAFTVAHKMLTIQPGVLAFNGKRAAKEFFGVENVEYGLCRESLDATRLFVLPSTAGNASGYWDHGPWHQLAAIVR